MAGEPICNDLEMPGHRKLLRNRPLGTISVEAVI